MSTQDKTKCDRCKDVPATVYFSVVSGKGKVTKKRYCVPCATVERIKLAPKMITRLENPAISVLNMVQEEMAKSAHAAPVVNNTLEGTIKRLEKELTAAVAKEDYETAAKIRDQIAVTKAKNP